jgi:RNase H-fold protein (predicted Holliday junction resolvase)
VGQALQVEARVEVHYQDEGWTTVEANARLGNAGLDARRRRLVVDAVAAQVILEDWLEACRPT